MGRTSMPPPLRAAAAAALVTSKEVEAAVAAVVAATRKAVRSSLRFLELFLVDPDGDEMIAVDAGLRSDAALPRRLRGVTWNAADNATTVWVLRVTFGPRSKTVHVRVESCSVQADSQGMMDSEEYELVEEAVKDDARVQEAMRRRGVTDMSMLMVDAWCSGYYTEEDHPRRRLSRPLLFVRTGDGQDNGYARPVEGLQLVVDHSTFTVVAFEDRGDDHAPLPPPDPMRNFHTPPTLPPAVPLKPISITQPDGPSWHLEGNAVSWHNWRFRVGFTPREGLTLHNLALYDVDQRRIRPVAHRLSFAEMVVPYGDPHAPHYRKNAFDAGEDGLGKNAHSLKLGCDCVGHVQYFDAHFTSFHGAVCSIANAVCMHEEDHGLGWKHVDWHTGVSSQRRSRRLVVSFVCTVANYEYGFFYYLYLDGRIEFEVKLTGVLSTTATVVGARSPYGTTLAPGLVSPVHQHFFNCRIHMAVDTEAGLPTENNIFQGGVRLHPLLTALVWYPGQVDTTTEPRGPDNPHNNAFAAHATPLETELQARRDCNSASSRFWLVTSSHARNRTGEPTGFRLIPHGNVHPLAHPEAAFMRRAQFLQHQLWVTRYHPEHRYPAGDFPNQNPRVGDGLPAWAAQDNSLRDASLVLWYTFGVTHVPRLEDWPVMPTEYAGFELKASGFFDRSPVVNTALKPSSVPPAAPPRSKL